MGSLLKTDITNTFLEDVSQGILNVIKNVYLNPETPILSEMDYDPARLWISVADELLMAKRSKILSSNNLRSPDDSDSSILNYKHLPFKELDTISSHSKMSLYSWRNSCTNSSLSISQNSKSDLVHVLSSNFIIPIIHEYSANIKNINTNCKSFSNLLVESETSNENISNCLQNMLEDSSIYSISGEKYEKHICHQIDEKSYIKNPEMESIPSKSNIISEDVNLESKRNLKGDFLSSTTNAKTWKLLKIMKRFVVQFYHSLKSCISNKKTLN
ncbi:hypothetical protein CDAR_290311 [Caerostris darwini]|uniref:Uncharacterized protein n=1 Tax=Caerostris darwini TaxID=1538125 RepID=A0AAV4T9K4_9ARAC|nr:hypothetical protein CDAR_290311 [Caerostris darwini]